MENTKPTQSKSFFLKLLGYIFLKVMILKPMHKYHHYMGMEDSIEELKSKATLKNVFKK